MAVALVVEHGVVDVPELGVPVGVLASLGGLGVALQAVVGLPQQPPHHLVREPEPFVPQRFRQLRSDFVVHRSGEVGSPRVAGSISASNAAARPRLMLLGPLASTARPARTPPGSGTARIVQLGPAPAHRVRRHPHRGRHPHRPARAQLPRLGAQPQLGGPASAG